VEVQREQKGFPSSHLIRRTLLFIRTYLVLLGPATTVTHLQVMHPVLTFGFPIRPFFRDVELLESVSDLVSDVTDDIFSFLIFMESFVDSQVGICEDI
jgi:hypothetical protein